MDNTQLEKKATESNAAHLERVRATLKERRQAAQDALELKRHLEEALAVAVRGGAAPPVRAEMMRALQQACRRLGVARGMVDITEAHLVVALNR